MQYHILHWPESTFIVSNMKNSFMAKLRNQRKQVYATLEEGHSLTSSIFNTIIMVLIILNVTAVILESEASLYLAYQSYFDYFELVSVVIFTIEYLLRLWSCVEKPEYVSGFRGRIRHMLSFMSIIDFIAIAPFYLSMFTDVDTRFLRVLRILRIFKLTRYFRPLEVLLQVIKQEGPVLISALFIMLILIVLASGGMYVAEHDSQPEVFGSILSSMWWAAVTLTTVGYGDVIPITTAGKLFAVMVTFLGVGMAALPAGIIASGFTREIERRRGLFQTSIREALKDGEIDKKGAHALERQRHELGLDVADAEAMKRSEQALLEEIEITTCPHCGEKLTK